MHPPWASNPAHAHHLHFARASPAAGKRFHAAPDPPPMRPTTEPHWGRGQCLPPLLQTWPTARKYGYSPRLAPRPTPPPSPQCHHRPQRQAVPTSYLLAFVPPRLRHRTVGSIHQVGCTKCVFAHQAQTPLQNCCAPIGRHAKRSSPARQMFANSCRSNNRRNTPGRQN